MIKTVAIYASNEIFERLKSKLEQFELHLKPTLSHHLSGSFIICDVDSFKNNPSGFGKADKSLLYILSHESDEENMKLIEQYQLHHLVGLNEQTFVQEIFDNILKKNNKSFWGLKSYLGSDTDERILSLSDSKNTNEMIQDALKHFDFEGFFSSPSEYIQVMANELISNSLYKGPNRKRQELGLDSVDRRDPVFLKGTDLVQVTLGINGKGVALSVQDSFGGLNYQTVIASLKRSFEEKTVMNKKDGAGLGLYLTYLHSNQFIINYREQFRTEVICIIDKNKRYKSYKQRIRSFHFFQEVLGEKT